METAIDHRPFLRRPVKLPRIMEFYPLVTLICELLYLIDVRGLLVTATVLTVAGVVAWLIRHKLSPLPPLPSGYVAPMWMVVIGYPVFTLFFIGAAIDIFFR